MAAEHASQAALLVARPDRERERDCERERERVSAYLCVSA
jgi:hypothetical protein